MLPINRILRGIEDAQDLDPNQQTTLDGVTAFMVFGAGTFAVLSIVALLFA